MFCKFCGHPVDGSKCSFCGKEISFIAHSTELEKIISNKAEAQSQTAEAPIAFSYEQGFDAGYQKGLSDGYQDGKLEAHSILSPASRFSWKMVAALCGAAFFIGTVVSGMIMRNIGFQSGFAQGSEEGLQIADEAKMQLDERYNLGFAAGKAEGFDNGKLAGIELGKTEATKQYAKQQEEARNRWADDVSIPSYTILFSQQINGGTKNEEVSVIQKILFDLGMFDVENKDVAVDGDYGALTTEAVKKYQKAKGLTATGNIDQITYDALLMELSPEDKTHTESLDDKVHNPDENPAILPAGHSDSVLIE